jgi:hypothetical protein
MGGRYVAMTPDESGHLWSQQLELYLGVANKQLRFFTPDKQLVPTPAKRAQEEAKQAQHQAEQAQQQANRLAAKLREMGVDPSTLEGKDNPPGETP